MNIQTILAWLNPAYIAQEISKAVQLFPLTIISSVVVAAQFVRTIHQSEGPNEFILAIGLLGISGFIAAELAAKSWRIANHDILSRLIYNALMLGLLIIVAFPLQSHDLTDFTIVKYIAFGAALHGLASIILYLGKRADDLSFWSFNAKMFIAAISSGILAWFLMAGILMILGALDLLFDVNVNDLYGDTMVIVAFPVLTTIFLARMPKVGQDHSVEITNFIHRLLSFIIWPLLMIYGAILWAYLFKIVIDGVMPRGVVWPLVGGFSIVLMLASALSWQHETLRNIARWTIRLSAPLLALQWIAIFQRIDQYGFTIYRTVAVYYSVLSSVIIVYFALRRNPKWLVVPTLGTVMAISLAYGPLSGETVGFRSQSNRFLDIVEQYELLNEGTWQVEMVDSLPDSARVQLRGTLYYLCETPERVIASEKLTFLHDQNELHDITFRILVDQLALDRASGSPIDIHDELTNISFFADSEWVEIADGQQVSIVPNGRLYDDSYIDGKFKMRPSDRDSIIQSILDGHTYGKLIKVPVSNKTQKGQLIILECKVTGYQSNPNLYLQRGLFVVDQD